MASNWIRVDAAIGDDKGLAKARRILGVSRPAMVGMCVLLEAELLAHHPSGVVAEIDPETLAEWAGFSSGGDQLSTKDVVKFSTALAEMTDGSGRLVGWEERHAVLLHRMARDAERKRQARESQRLAREDAERAQNVSSGRPKDGVKTSSRRPNATERNGTERDVSANYSADSLHSESGQNSERPASLRSGPKSPVALPPTALQFLDRFYPVAGKRRADVERQLVKLAAGEMLTIGKGQYVQAYTADRLETKCALVIADSSNIHDLNAAIAILFAKLGDTTDAAGSGQLPGQQAAAAYASTEPLDDRVQSLVDGVASELPDLHRTSSSPDSRGRS